MLEFFPPGIFRDSTETVFPDDQRYAKWLEWLDEASLWQMARNPGTIEYRWLWLRSFHPTVTVRVSLTSGTGRLIAKLDTALQADRLRQVRVIDRQLGVKELQRFASLLEAGRFWQLPSQAYLLRTDASEYSRGEDGAQWVLEGVRDGRYQVVDRWSPASNGSRGVREFRKCCLYLLELSGFPIPKEDIY